MSRAEEMVEALRQWQAIERRSIDETAQIVERSSSPFIRLIMEIIRHDSLMHHRVEQFLVDTLEKDSVAVTREDIAQVWESIEAHDKHEKKAIQLAEELQKKAWTPVHKLVLEYLVKEESKHDTLLQQLDALKKDLTRSSGG